jgi:hypothetical protein
MKTGDEVAGGFRVAEAREGYFELVRELQGGGAVHFSASAPEKVLAQAASWTAAQLARKDRGALAAAGPTVVARGGSGAVLAPKPKPKKDDEVAA